MAKFECSTCRRLEKSVQKRGLADGAYKGTAKPAALRLICWELADGFI